MRCSKKASLFDHLNRRPIAKVDGSERWRQGRSDGRHRGRVLPPQSLGLVAAEARRTFLDEGGGALTQIPGGLRVWQQPFKQLRAPLLTNLRMDPFERADDENAMGYQLWYAEHMFAFAPAAASIGNWLQSFREFPPRQKPGSFNLDRVMEAITNGKGDN
jgi:hypothetical protein